MIIIYLAFGYIAIASSPPTSMWDIYMHSAIAQLRIAGDEASIALGPEEE